MLKIRVTEAPEKGRANEAVIALLAKTLSLPKRDVTLISGDSSRKKRLLLPKAAESIISGWREKGF
ncbi:conserved hypothetical protein [Chlamydia felis Fe/C-56]|uniref:Uncharacterized protein n=1 Tax=Chlamydia felis (strain Fe/C-56) TaxID=264202 RepID=Q253K7_CHLFF|nr:conserved hypothetical protein [Chlamydia felis Fe/C-56]